MGGACTIQLALRDQFGRRQKASVIFDIVVLISLFLGPGHNIINAPVQVSGMLDTAK
jgi:hypothetical protein